MVGQGREKFSNGNIVEGSFFKNKHNGPCRKKYENGDSPIMNSPNVNSPLGCSPNRGGPFVALYVSIISPVGPIPISLFGFELEAEE